MKKKLCQALQILTFLYFILMAAVFPLYTREGYLHIGTVKYHFFRYTGILLAFIFLLSLIYAAYVTPKNWSFSVTDWLVTAYGLVVLLSFLESPFREENMYGNALWGSNGWYMGFVTQMLFVLIYFMISRFFCREKLMVIIFLMSSAVVFFLGICNRFGIYPISMEGAEPGFISTLGNINWYCGYCVVIFPFGYMLYLNAQERRKKILLGGYLVLGFATCCTQGSDSGFLALFVLFLCGVWVGFVENKKVLNFLETIIIFGVATQLIHFVRILVPKAINYDNDMIRLFTNTNLTLWMTLITILFYIVVFFVDKAGVKAVSVWKILRGFIFAISVLAFVAYIMLVYINTKYPLQTPSLNGHPLFTYNSEFFNGRGISWKAGLSMFMELSFWNRLVGIGPDCFASYAYLRYTYIWEVDEIFGNLVLTNAHNEAITLLVNLGIWGCAAFFGAMISLIKRAFYYGKYHFVLYSCAACVVGYLVNSMVSFSQIINTTTLFIILGITEGLLRRHERSDSKIS